MKRTFYDGRIIHACARVPNYPSYIATMVQIELAAPSSNPTFGNFAHKLFSAPILSTGFGRQSKKKNAITSDKGIRKHNYDLYHGL